MVFVLGLEILLENQLTELLERFKNVLVRTNLKKNTKAGKGITVLVMMGG